MIILLLKRIQSRNIRAASVVLVACLAFSPVFAAEVAVQVGSSVTNDSNPFRFYDGEAAAAQNGNPNTSDKTFAATVSGGVILPLASDETRLILTGSLGDQVYKNYTDLDNQPKAGNAVFEWVAYDVLSGNINVGTDKRLFQYINGSLNQKDMSLQKLSSAEIKLKITEDLSVPIRLDKTTLDYELPQDLVYNSEVRGAQIGVRYQTGTGSSLETGVRFSRTEFPDRTAADILTMDDAYKETEAYVQGDWKYSVKTSVDAHLGIVKRQYEHLADRDQNLFSASAHAEYLYSPKLRLDVQLWNRPYSISDQTVLYVVSTGGRVDGSWAFSDKTNLRLFVLGQHDNYHLVDTASSDNGTRAEQVVRTGVTINYNLERGFRLFLDGFYEHLREDGGLPDLHQSVLRLGIEYTFESMTGSASKMGLSRYRPSLSSYDPLN